MVKQKTQAAGIALLDTQFPEERRLRMAGEPRWLENRRSKLFERFRKNGLPGPGEEEWRGTDLRSLGLLNRPVSFSRSAGFTPLLETPDRLRPYLFNAYDPDQTPSLAALNSALSQEGALLHWPAGLQDGEVEERVFQPPATQELFFPHNLIVLEEGSRGAFLEDYGQAESSGPAFANSVTEVFVGKNARVDLLTLIRWPNKTTCCHRAVAHVAEGGTLRWYIGTLGSSLARIDAEVSLEGTGANSRIIGLGIGEDSRHLDHRTVQRHGAGDSNSRIQFGTLLWGKSTSIYRGLIRMEEDAIRADAYQKNDNLILETGPSAQAIPKLEILTDEVKCSHGSTVGRIRDDDLFYLTSRGIPRAQAKILIAEGFIRRTLAGPGETHPLVENLQRVLVDKVRALATPESNQ